MPLLASTVSVVACRDRCSSEIAVLGHDCFKRWNVGFKFPMAVHISPACNLSLEMELSFFGNLGYFNYLWNLWACPINSKLFSKPRAACGVSLMRHLCRGEESEQGQHTADPLPTVSRERETPWNLKCSLTWFSWWLQRELRQLDSALRCLSRVFENESTFL